MSVTAVVRVMLYQSFLINGLLLFMQKSSNLFKVAQFFILKKSSLSDLLAICDKDEGLSRNHLRFHFNNCHPYSRGGGAQSRVVCANHFSRF
jgi:hypothetical protein